MNLLLASRRLGLTVVLLLVLPATDAFAAKPQFELRYRFQPSQFVHFEVTHDMTLVTRNGEKSDTVRTEKVTHKHFRVVSVDQAGNAVLEPMIDRIRFLIHFNDNAPVKWDSTSGTAPPQGFEVLSAQLQKPQARMKVDSRGNLLSVVRLQNAADADPAADADSSHNFLVVLPEEPVEVGGKWDQELQVKVRVPEFKRLQRTIRINRTFTLRSVEDNVAVIDFDSAVLTPVSDGAVRAQLIQRAPSGTFEFDIERGLITSHSWNIDKQEVDLFGPRSLMWAKTQHQERTVKPEPVDPKPIGPPPAPAIAAQPK